MQGSKNAPKQECSKFYMTVLGRFAVNEAVRSFSAAY